MLLTAQKEEILMILMRQITIAVEVTNKVELLTEKANPSVPSGRKKWRPKLKTEEARISLPAIRKKEKPTWS
jgi:hypothetical protein